MPKNAEGQLTRPLAPQEATNGGPMTTDLPTRLDRHRRLRAARGASAEELALLAEARAEIERLRLMRETSQEVLRECMAELREAREENLALREQDR